MDKFLNDELAAVVLENKLAELNAELGEWLQNYIELVENAAIRYGDVKNGCQCFEVQTFDEPDRKCDLCRAKERAANLPMRWTPTNLQVGAKPAIHHPIPKV